MPIFLRKAFLTVLFALAMLGMFQANSVLADVQPIKQMGHIDLLKTINAARGKVIMVNFFASWCQPCQLEIPGLIDLREELPEDEVLMLGISMDEDMRALERYVEKTPFNYPVYYGDINMARVFQVTSLPKMLIYNKRGGLVVKHNGFVPKSDLREVLESLLQQ